jgi:hypothetical protein
MQAKAPRQILLDCSGRGLMHKHISPCAESNMTFAAKGMSLHLGASAKKSWAISHVQVACIYQVLEQACHNAGLNPCLQHKILVAAFTNLIACLGWLRGGEIFQAEETDLVVTLPINGGSLLELAQWNARCHQKRSLSPLLSPMWSLPSQQCLVSAPANGLYLFNPSFQKFVENCSLLKLLLSGPVAIFRKRLLFLSLDRCVVKANLLFNVSQASPEIVCKIRSPPCTHGAKLVAQQCPVSLATMNPTLLGAAKPLSGKCMNMVVAGLSVSVPKACPNNATNGICQIVCLSLFAAPKTGAS